MFQNPGLELGITRHVVPPHFSESPRAICKGHIYQNGPNVSCSQCPTLDLPAHLVGPRLFPVPTGLGSVASLPSSSPHCGPAPSSAFCLWTQMGIWHPPCPHSTHSLMEETKRGGSHPTEKEQRACGEDSRLCRAVLTWRLQWRCLLATWV